MKCCFFKFFNSPVTLKNKKKFGPPQEKVEMTPLRWIWRTSSAEEFPPPYQYQINLGLTFQYEINFFGNWHLPTGNITRYKRQLKIQSILVKVSWKKYLKILS